MRNTLNFVVLVLLYALALSPATVIAQTTGGSNVASSSNSQFYRDGSNEPTSVRQERIRGYRQQSSDLQQKINSLGSTANVSVLMPVLFGVGIKDISPNFGDPRSGGRLHEGEDIMAVKGTPIVSPTPAVVLRTGVGETEGNYVYTANPGGETFVYMHLDRIGEGVVSGAVLAQGSLVGYVGNTGNASGGPAHLHFEIHNSGNAMDPFPRLTAEFSIQEKMLYLSTILLQTSDSTVLSQFLVTNFRGTFIAALAANIILPLPIIDAMTFISETQTSGNGGGISVPLPAGDLDIDSSGAAVVALQKYLIQAASGATAVRLASAGATGYFGIITKAALVEYQVAVGISPPSGYYGPTTRAFIVSHPLAVSEPPVPNSSSTGGSTINFSRNLFEGMSGDDIRALQKVLNVMGFTVAPVGLDSTGSPRAGSSGNETNYFGPATKAAVIKYQVAHNISPAVGYVGPLTRATLSVLKF